MTVSLSGAPQSVRDDVQVLGQALDASPIPPKALDRNLLVATWNVRHLGAVTQKWQSDPGDSPKRNLRDVLCLAEIVSRFDVVALQEVRRDLEGLRLMMRALGPTGESPHDLRGSIGFALGRILGLNSAASGSGSMHG